MKRKICHLMMSWWDMQIKQQECIVYYLQFGLVYFVSINTQYILFDRELCSLNLLVPPSFIIWWYNVLVILCWCVALLLIVFKPKLFWYHANTHTHCTLGGSITRSHILSKSHLTFSSDQPSWEFKSSIFWLSCQIFSLQSYIFVSRGLSSNADP